LQAQGSDDDGRRFSDVAGYKLLDKGDRQFGTDVKAELERMSADLGAKLHTVEAKLDGLALHLNSCAGHVHQLVQQSFGYLGGNMDQDTTTNSSSRASFQHPCHFRARSMDFTRKTPLESETKVAGSIMEEPISPNAAKVGESEEGGASRRVSTCTASESLPSSNRGWNCNSASAIETATMFTMGPSRGLLMEKLWNFFDDPDSTTVAWIYSCLWPLFIAGTALATLSRNVDLPPLVDPVATGLEIAFEVAFAVEVSLRFMVCPRRRAFVQNPFNLIDFATAAPLLFRVAAGSGIPDGRGTLKDFVLLCIVPILRLLKLFRRFQQFHLFVKVFVITVEALEFLLFTLLVIVLVFSSLIYIVEPSENISSLSHATWLTIVTLTTVGYGDITPETTAGCVIITVLMMGSALYMAMPIGILGDACSQVWNDRDRILLVSKTRERLAQWGYTAQDILKIFNRFDVNLNGELSLDEFRKMVADMHIGLQDDRVVQLFETLDRDGGGGIDDKEFVRSLFPGSFHEIYGGTHGKLRRQKRRSRASQLGVRERKDSVTIDDASTA